MQINENRLYNPHNFLLLAGMIRLISILFLGVFLVNTSVGQESPPSKLIWKVNRINLGTLLEEEGPQQVSFEYTLSQGSPFAIEEVRTDCGCTTVSFSKDTLQLEQSGMISVSFDPSAAAGFFSKLVVVQGGQGQIQDSLFVEGIAIPYPVDLDRNYPVKLGQIGLRLRKINMGEVFDNEPKQKYVEFFNAGSSPLTKSSFYAQTPSYIHIEQVQGLVRPKERGLLKVSYDASQRTDLGAVVDKIGISWSSNDLQMLELEVLANLFDYFAPIKREELDLVPQLFFDEKIVDLGEISSKEIQRKSVTLTNLGKEKLEVRKLQGNCTCLLLELPVKELYPGETTALTLVFDPQGRKGIDQRNIYLFTNDPVNPVQLLVLKSRIK